MKLKDTFTQETLRMILPSKIALVVDTLSRRSGEDSVKLMLDFYQSETYARLQIEATKYWWFGPAELCELYKREGRKVNC